MPNRPLVSVIIPTYNSARFVSQAVESALRQTYSPLEIIVIDDGSTDETRNTVSSFEDRIVYIYQPNSGVSVARNRGLAESKGELIAFLDADDQWLPDKVEKQWRCIEARPDVGLVHTDLYRIYEPDQTKVHEYRNRERFSGSCYEEFFWGNAVMTSTVLLRRSCIAAVGDFDDNIRYPSTEDLDLWMRIARVAALAYVDEPLIIYREHPENNSKDLHKMVENEYAVLSRAFETRPDIHSASARQKISDRLYCISYEAGYANMEREDRVRSRHFFSRAIRYKPGSFRAWLMWASALLPTNLRRALRRIKQHFARG